jgi:hypothetical protein
MPPGRMVKLTGRAKPDHSRLHRKVLLVGDQNASFFSPLAERNQSAVD